jgi:cytochrome c-type biogenesis protein CcmH/NrfF
MRTGASPIKVVHVVRRPRAVALPALLASLLIAAGSLAGARAAYAVTPRTSLPVIERQVMCVTCKIPLQVAESPQADREREFIQVLINRGDSESQIKAALVEQYGPAVLALPPAHGFNLAAYLVPVAAVLLLIAVLSMLLPRWRRQSRANAARAAPAVTLSAEETARLDADLARFD